jgi:hypothetical protein
MHMPELNSSAPVAWCGDPSAMRMWVLQKSANSFVLISLAAEVEGADIIAVKKTKTIEVVRIGHISMAGSVDHMGNRRR